MRLFEFIMESRSADLYHGTDLSGALGIIKSNKISGNHGVSLSRDIRVAPRFGNVVLSINQNLLYRDIGKRLKPQIDLDYNSGKGPNQATEYEEYVTGTIENANKYITKISIIVPPENINDIDIGKYKPLLLDPRVIVSSLDNLWTASIGVGNNNVLIKDKPKELMTGKEYIEYRRQNPNPQKLSSREEQKILKDPMKAYEYAKNVIRGRWPKAEPIILKNERTAYLYAKDVIKGRWPEAESLLLENDSGRLSEYATNVIRGRWPEAEPYIMKHPYAAYAYARDVIKGRWPEAEPYIMKHPDAAYDYAKDVIKGRWPEAEPNIKRGWQWNSYKNYFKF